MILGTAAYMSPEQARGKTVDKRADIWAFGVVLYEMLTGKRLFQGETMADTLAAVVTKEPDWERRRRSCGGCCEGAWRKIRRSGCGISAMRWLLVGRRRAGLRPAGAGAGQACSTQSWRGWRRGW